MNLRRRQMFRAVAEALEDRRLFTGDGLQAAYFDNPTLSGTPTYRVDPQINLDWRRPALVRATVPNPTDAAPNQVSVAWTGSVVAPVTGRYTFYLASQGAAQLTLNGNVLISAWRNHAAQTRAKAITLQAGQSYSLELDFEAGKFKPMVRLSWYYKAKGSRTQVIPPAQLYSGVAAAPSDLTATQISGNEVDLAWINQADNAAQLQIQRSIDGINFGTVATVPAGSTTFADTSVPPGRNLLYQVIAVNPSGDSGASNPAAILPPAPAQPVALDATGVSGNEIDLAWQDPTGYSGAYQIERSTDGGQTFQPLALVNAPATTFADTTLQPNTNYTYRVSAANDTAVSPPTYPIIANTLSGFSTPSHPAPTILGWNNNNDPWQFASPTDAELLDSERPGNIFYTGDPISFDLSPGGYAATYEVRDYYGNLVDSGPVTQQLTLTLQSENPGWYKVYLYSTPAAANATFGDVVGGTTFCVFRNDPNFPLTSDWRAGGYDFSEVFTRLDPNINFTSAWSNNTPDPAQIPSGPFAAQWTGQLRPTQTGTYTLWLDGGPGRLWLNGQEVINAWRAYYDPYTYTTQLVAGQKYDIRIEYYHGTTPATASFYFSWSSTSIPLGKQAVPQSVLYSSPTSTAGTGDGLVGTYYGLLQTLSANDQVVRAITGMGPQRYVADASNPAATIAALATQITFDSQYYMPLDPQRNRGLLIAFPNGTEPYLSGVTQIVQAFQNQVEYWEPQNEPNGSYATGADFVPIMRDFYNTVKAVNPNLKVIGPDPVTIGPYGLTWLKQFFAAGGGQYIDALSFHAYNNVNRDLTLARESLNGLKTLLNQYGLGNIPIWQTEQGYMAAVYGDYEPENQGEWTMLEQMVFEQFGIPKEQNVLWYDVSHGFWDAPMFWENGGGGLNPAAPLMRVWSEELYGTNFSQAYDFGADGNNTYIGSLFSGPGKNVAVFMTGGATDGQVNLNVTGGNTLTVVDAFGNMSTVPVVNGQATIDVPILPVYVEIAAGQSITVVPVNWGPDLATQPGVTASSTSDGVSPIGGNDSIDKIHDGVLQNWYYNQGPNDRVWLDDTPPGTTNWVELDLPVAASIDHVVVRAPAPWQWDGAPLDFDLQYYVNGQWITIQHFQEDPKDFAVYSPETATTVDSYYSERSIFISTFTPVTTSKIRLVVNSETWGGGVNLLAAQAGGQTSAAPYLTLQEIEVYGQ